MRLSRFLPALLVAVALASVACAGGGESSDVGAGGGGGEPLSVVASFYPLAEAASSVGGKGVEVTNLTPSGVEPHDLELNPDQLDRIASADVVLYLGSGFQPAVEDAVTTIAEGKTVDLLQGVASPITQGGGSPSGQLASDPHVWLSPVLMQQLIAKIETALADIDPAGASIYRDNAAAYDKTLQSLDADFRAGLAACERRVIVTSHAAFAYLAKEYGLVQEPVAGISPQQEPDARTLATLADQIRRDGTTTVYTEELVSPKVAETLASETGTTTAVLSPIEGLTPEQLDAGETYASRMRANLAALQKGLGCQGAPAGGSGGPG